MSEVLSREEQKRLHKLQESMDQGFTYERLTLGDLFLMLRHDPALRALVAQVAQAPEVVSPPVPAAPAAQPAVKEMDELAEPLALLVVLERDAELTEALGPVLEDRDSRVTALIACAANWDRIEAAWEVLAKRCKLESRAATSDERRVLTGCVAIHNRIWLDRKAIAVDAGQGAQYDYRIHDRGTASGETIASTWLPGLKNAAGLLRKKTLVATS